MDSRRGEMQSVSLEGWQTSYGPIWHGYGIVETAAPLAGWAREDPLTPAESAAIGGWGKVADLSQPSF